MAINKMKVLPALLLAGAALLSGCSNSDTAENANSTLEDLVSAKDLEASNKAMDNVCEQFITATGEKAYSDCEIFAEDNILVKEYTYAIDPTSVTSKEAIKESLEVNGAMLSAEVKSDIKNFNSKYSNLPDIQIAYRYITPDGSLFAEIVCEEDGTCVFSE